MAKLANNPVLVLLLWIELIKVDLSELGLDQDPSIDMNSVASLLDTDPALEQEIRRILDEHMELAWQEIRELIRRGSA